EDFWWADDERIVISMAQTFGSEDAQYLTGEVHVLELGGKRVRRLVGPGPPAGIVQNVMTVAHEYAFVIDPGVVESGAVLVSTWLPGTTPRTHVERLNLRSGRRAVVASAPVRRARFTLDPSGGVRFADGSDVQNYREL